MGKMLLLVVGVFAAVFVLMTVTPEPYDDWLLVALMLGSLGASAVTTWRANRLAGDAPLVAKLRRTSHQRHSLWIAAFLAAVFVWSILDDPQTGDPTKSTLFWIVLTMVALQLLVGLPSGKITEAGIVIHGTLFRWASLKNFEWVPGEAATLSYGVEKRGRLLNGKWKLNPADVEPVTAALSKYADYSPIAGS